MAKKVLSIALALLMVVNVFAVAVSATEWTTEESVITLTTDNAKPQPGDEVTVTVSLQNNYNVHALQIMMAYDKNYYDVVGASASEAFTALLADEGAKFSGVVQSLLGSEEQEAMYAGQYTDTQKAQYGLLRIGYVWLTTDALGGNAPTGSFATTTALASFKLKVKATAPTDGKGAIMVAPEYVVDEGTDVPDFDTRSATYVGKGAATVAESASTGKLYGLPIDVTGAVFAGCTHAGVEAVAAKNATHTQAGNTAYWYCADCETYFADAALTVETTLDATVVPATGHGDTSAIAWSSDADNHWKDCSCGEKLEVAAHTFEWVIDEDSTCDKEGVQHEECTVCGFKKSEGTTVAKKEHAIAKVEAKNATCTEDGNTEYWACPNCAKYYADEACTEVITLDSTVIPATGHTEGEWVIVTNETCTEDGEKTLSCTVCEEVIKTEVIPATGHTEVALEAVAPTCTETGLTAGVKCSVCEEILVAQEVIAATGHDWGEWVTITPADVGVQGLEKRTCKNCDAFEENILPALDEPDANYDEINALVEEYNALNRDKYKPESLKALDDAIASIDYTLKDSQQAIVDAKVVEIEAAFAALVEKPATLADYEALESAIATIPDGPNRTNGVYDAAELAAIDEMVAGFDMFLSSDDQETVDGYTAALTAAVKALTMDLSKATAKIETQLSQKVVKTGDVINVTVKVTTNYPVATIQLPILYDKTEFQLVNFTSGKSYLTFNEEGSFVLGSYDFNGNAGITTGFSRTSNPDKWNTAAAKAQYDYAWMTAAFNIGTNPSNIALAVPNEEVFVTYQLKALKDVDDATQSVFISTEWARSDAAKTGTFMLSFSPTVENRDPLSFKTSGMTYITETTAIEGSKVSGTVQSYNDGIDNSDVTTIEFFAEGSDVAAYTATTEGSGKLTYTLDAVVAGTYTVKVSKANHVTREYTVTVGAEDITQDMKICLLGDITGDGRVGMPDLAILNSYLTGSATLDDYAVKCADVTGDSRVGMPDLAKLNSYLTGLVQIWK